MEIKNYRNNITRNKSKALTSDKFIPKAYKNVAGKMETQFLKLMMEQMDKSVNRSKKEDSAGRFYKSMIREQRSERMSEQLGLNGIKKMILNQIYPKHLRTKQNLMAYDKQNNDRMNNMNKIRIEGPTRATISKFEVLKSDEVIHE